MLGRDFRRAGVGELTGAEGGEVPRPGLLGDLMPPALIYPREKNRAEKSDTNKTRPGRALRTPHVARDVYVKHARNPGGSEAAAMTREQKYTEQLKQLGIYQELFAPEIRSLAQMERDLRRLTKRWRAARYQAEGNDETQSEALSEIIIALQRDINEHRSSLCLPPKDFYRLKQKGST